MKTRQEHNSIQKFKINRLCKSLMLMSHSVIQTIDFMIEIRPNWLGKTHRITIVGHVYQNVWYIE